MNCVILFILTYIASIKKLETTFILDDSLFGGFLLCFSDAICGKFKGYDLSIIIWLNGAFQIFITQIPKKGNRVSNIVTSLHGDT